MSPTSIDPLAEVVTLLQPGATLSKLVSARGPWRVRRSEAGQVFYCVVLDGTCRLAAAGQEPIPLHKGDFVLVPSAYDLTASSLEPPVKDTVPVARPNGEFRLGVQRGQPDVRMLIGHCTFGSPDAALLVSLLPRLVHLRNQRRLGTLVRLLREESLERRPARDIILARLLEVLLIEAFRSTAGTEASSGLLRGLADERLAAAIRRLHEQPTKPWTVAQLAKEAGLSRSTFFERFSHAVGVAPMEYLLGWRMALAKDLLRRRDMSVGEVAEHVGYSSASTFSVAFTRHVGLPPKRYARTHAESPNP
jgi:AraC-like DNA-binding protein